MVNTVNLTIPGIDRTEVQVNGEVTLYLNLSDANIVPRLQAAIPKLEQLQNEYTNKEFSEDSNLDVFAEELIKLDTAVKEQLNYIFDFDICTPLCGNSSIMSPIGGQPKYLYIMNALSDLYAETVQNEIKALESKVAQRTSKYTKKKG